MIDFTPHRFSGPFPYDCVLTYYPTPHRFLAFMKKWRADD